MPVRKKKKTPVGDTGSDIAIRLRPAAPKKKKPTTADAKQRATGRVDERTGGGGGGGGADGPVSKRVAMKKTEHTGVDDSHADPVRLSRLRKKTTAPPTPPSDHKGPVREGADDTRYELGGHTEARSATKREAARVRSSSSSSSSTQGRVRRRPQPIGPDAEQGRESARCPDDCTCDRPCCRGPRGCTGAQGERGKRGRRGSRGGDGAQGGVGPQGPCCSGQTGAQGSAGPQGATGNTGAQGFGPQGLAGPQGPAGNTGGQGRGPQGAQGDAGAQGATGGQGQAGPTGAQGAAFPVGLTVFVAATFGDDATGRVEQPAFPFATIGAAIAAAQLAPNAPSASQPWQIQIRPGTYGAEPLPPPPALQVPTVVLVDFVNLLGVSSAYGTATQAFPASLGTSEVQVQGVLSDAGVVNGGNPNVTNVSFYAPTFFAPSLRSDASTSSNLLLLSSSASSSSSSLSRRVGAPEPVSAAAYLACGNTVTLTNCNLVATWAGAVVATMYQTLVTDASATTANPTNVVLQSCNVRLVIDVTGTGPSVKGYTAAVIVALDSSFVSLFDSQVSLLDNSQDVGTPAANLYAIQSSSLLAPALAGVQTLSSSTAYTLTTTYAGAEAPLEALVVFGNDGTSVSSQNDTVDWALSRVSVISTGRTATVVSLAFAGTQAVAGARVVGMVVNLSGTRAIPILNLLANNGNANTVATFDSVRFVGVRAGADGSAAVPSQTPPDVSSSFIATNIVLDDLAGGQQRTGQVYVPGGGGGHAVAYTATPVDAVILCEPAGAGGGPTQVTLPFAYLYSGRTLTVKNLPLGEPASVQPQSTDSIEGGAPGASYVIASAGGSATLISDGATNWWVIGAYCCGAGAQGMAGAQGGTGAQGDAGAQGQTGGQGQTGAQGPSGAQGDDGPQGQTGGQGQTGAQGQSGAQGDVGPQGQTGGQGQTGAQGQTGGQGQTGAQGQTGGQGQTGNQGEAGGQGQSGAQGPMGPQGQAGTQGAAGSQGGTGGQGQTGTQGDVGPQGGTGAQGVPGTQGAQGSTGATGAQGAGVGESGAFGPSSDITLTADQQTILQTGPLVVAAGSVSVIWATIVVLASMPATVTVQGSTAGGYFSNSSSLSIPASGGDIYSTIPYMSRFVATSADSVTFSISAGATPPGAGSANVTVVAGQSVLEVFTVG